MKKILLLLFIAFNCFYSNAQESLIVGYLPTYRFKVSDKIDFCKLTHLNICFANPDKHGEIIEIDSLSEILTIVRNSNPNIKVNLSLAGGALRPEEAKIWKEFVDVPKKRPVLIKSIIEFVEKYNFNGVDMDLEWKNVTRGYSPFVLALKEELDKTNKAFTAAFPAIKRYKHLTDEALASFDYVNIMAYDERGSWAPKSAGPHSSYEFAQRSIFFWNELQKVPAHKLTLGLPFYAYDFTNPRKTKSFMLKEIVRMDPNNIQNDSLGLIFYNGIPTIKRKVAYAIENAAGVMVWELGQDSTNQFSLLSAIHHKVKELGANDNLENCDIPEQDLYAFGLTDFKESIQFKTNVKEKYFTLLSKNIKNISIILTNKKNRTIKLRTNQKGQKKTFKIKKLRKGIYAIEIKNKQYSFKKKLTIEKKKKK